MLLRNRHRLLLMSLDNCSRHINAYIADFLNFSYSNLVMRYRYLSRHTHANSTFVICSKQLMLVSSVPKTGRTCLTHKGICDRLPSTIQRNCIEKGDGKIQQRLQGVSAGMSSYAAICLLKASRAHEEAYSFVSHL